MLMICQLVFVPSVVQMSKYAGEPQLCGFVHFGFLFVDLINR